MPDNREHYGVIEAFASAMSAFVLHREDLQVVFMKSRLELLREVHRKSMSKLSLEEWLLSANDRATTFNSHPWTGIETYSGSPEQELWEILFTHGPLRGDYSGKETFMRMFNRFLKAEGIKIRLVNRGLGVSFSSGN